MSNISQPPPKEAIKSPYLSVEEWAALNESVPVIKSRRTGSSYTGQSISELLKGAVATAAGATWISTPSKPTILAFNEETGKLERVKLEKELTEKQLFSKLKKELKEVKNLIN